MATKTACCGRAYGSVFDKAWWLRSITEGRTNPKPPQTWFAMKADKGFTAAAAGRIWFRNYKPEKKAMHWAMADLSEWCAAGMHITEDE